MTNWKTTLAGIAAILVSIAAIITTIVNGTFDVNLIVTNGAAILAGIGLLFGKDWNVTGGTKQQ